LREKIAKISTVEEWAEELGYDTKTFARKYRNKFGSRPKAVIIQTKLDLAVDLLHNNPEMSCYDVARAIGKEDEKALNYFFYTHLKKSPRSHKSKE